MELGNNKIRVEIRKPELQQHIQHIEALSIGVLRFF